MSSIREQRTVLIRYENDTQVDSFRRYYLIFEGNNMEKKYFQGIKGFRKEIDEIEQCFQ